MSDFEPFSLSDIPSNAYSQDVGDTPSVLFLDSIAPPEGLAAYAPTATIAADSPGFLSPPPSNDLASLRDYYTDQYRNFDQYSQKWMLTDPRAGALSIFPQAKEVLRGALNQSFIAADWGVDPERIGFHAYPLHRSYYSFLNFPGISNDETATFDSIQSRLADYANTNATPSDASASLQPRVTFPGHLFTPEDMSPAMPTPTRQPQDDSASDDTGDL